ncbi:hypothetical protein MPAR168_00660 [Methylorubrum populi]|uniref:HTH lysR-type domain-containing protein n=1 Tax=Methylobacterium radiotolerans TaxID=31998 RepID=A0ABU7T8D0_9HYPH
MNIGSFDLNLLKAFGALYAERHVTRAGLRIGLSQSAMSGTLTRLRELLADELFMRTPSGMQPTARADELAGPVADALRLVRGALQADGFEPATAERAFTVRRRDSVRSGHLRGEGGARTRLASVSPLHHRRIAVLPVGNRLRPAGIRPKHLAAPPRRP